MTRRNGFWGIAYAQPFYPLKGDVRPRRCQGGAGLRTAATVGYPQDASPYTDPVYRTPVTVYRHDRR
jgi:hypothetical protein